MATYYTYIHRFTNGTIYIGKGKKQRLLEDTSRNTYWHNLKNKYGEPIRGIVNDNLTEEEAFQDEINLIALYKTLGVKLCNITNGGEGCSGYTHTKKHKQYMSKVAKQWMNTPEGKDIRSKNYSGKNNPMYGVPSWCKGLTKETDIRVKQISEKLKGKPKSELHKKKLSESRKGKKIGPLNTTKYTFYNTETKQTVIATVYEMRNNYDCSYHISSVITKKRKSHKNWMLLN